MSRALEDDMNNFMNHVNEEIQKDPELKKFSLQEELILDITELIAKLMQEKKIIYTKLAELLSMNYDYIKHILEGSEGSLLRQIADIFIALGSKLVVTYKELK